MGYAGGTTPDPTYRNMGDHTETLQIKFNPDQISYSALLEIFWSDHNPSSYPYSRQYRAVVFYHNPEQKELAEKTREELAEKTGRNVYTAIEPYTNFYSAEDYHQKYYLQANRRLIGELKEIYPDFTDLVYSTAAARINGYIMGYGTSEELERDLPELGLSERAQSDLISAFQRRN